MNKTIRATFIIIALLWQSTAIADTISDRLTVTVQGQGPDVILIPGLACSTAVWDATVAHLGGHYRLHLVQVAGFAGAPARSNATGLVIQPTVDALDAYIKTNHLKSPRIIHSRNRDLPDPLDPTSAVVDPSGALKETSFNTGTPGLYSKLT